VEGEAVGRRKEEREGGS
jgi:hypothetical protein